MRSLTRRRYGSSRLRYHTSETAAVEPPHVEWYGALTGRPA